jgi:hypothetical protein
VAWSSAMAEWPGGKAVAVVQYVRGCGPGVEAPGGAAGYGLEYNAGNEQLAKCKVSKYLVYTHCASAAYLTVTCAYRRRV